jgi:DNA-binding IscR family transcriptional regulator
VSSIKKISNRFSVAVHVLALISLSQVPCTSEFIAQSVNTNPVIIRRIIGNLKKANLVRVKSGVGGAYLLQPLDAITLLDVYRAVEVVEEGDLFNFHDNPNPDCIVGANIELVLRKTTLDAQAAMERIFAGVTLEQVVSGLAGDSEGIRKL